MRKNSIAKEILILMAAGGVLTLGILLSGPYILKILRALGRDYNRFARQRVKMALRELERKEIVKFQKEGNEVYIKLTPEGKRQILKYKTDELKFKRMKKWDKKWRMIIFDIPERFKKARRAFSYALRGAGAYRFQKSVFVYPDDCEDEVRFLMELYGVNPFVKYVEAEKIDSEKILKHNFEIYS